MKKLIITDLEWIWYLELQMRSGNVWDMTLTTHWAYAAHPWFPLVPLNPSFNSPIFECLNHLMFSLRTELDSQGKHILHHNIRESWVKLEKKLLWCQEFLGAGLLVPWETKLPCPPAQYGYQRLHSDTKLTKKVTLKSRNAFLCMWMIYSVSLQLVHA